MQQVADGVFRLGSKGHNFYILRDRQEATIIDAGCSREWSKLIRGLESNGLTLDSVAGVIVTHSHADHFGLAKRAADEGLEVSVHEDEESRALGTYTGRYGVSAGDLPILRLPTLKNFLPIVLAGVMTLEYLERVATFSNGDRLDLPGHPRVIHTPGHTEGHTMFHCPEKGILFTGDGLVTMDLIGTSVGPQMMDKRFHQNQNRAWKSLARIQHLDADLLLPGHGDPWAGSPAAALIMIRD